MAPETGKMIWHNGELIAWDDAKIHVMSHVVNYGSSLFGYGHGLPLSDPARTTDT